jgi:hypothetical protein
VWVREGDACGRLQDAGRDPYLSPGVSGKPQAIAQLWQWEQPSMHCAHMLPVHRLLARVVATIAAIAVAETGTERPIAKTGDAATG